MSRGGDKLRGALDAFGINPKGLACLDIGSSTGGFTDCLLQAGARSVWCVDVGYGLLDYKLRNDPRVNVIERTNIRHFDPKQITAPIGLVVVDVSFISLTKVLPKIAEFIQARVDIIALVKPQFEGTPKEVPGGYVKDEKTRQSILDKVRGNIPGMGFRLLKEADSQIKGRQGNQETFFHLVI